LLQAASPETSGYTLVRWYAASWCICNGL